MATSTCVKCGGTSFEMVIDHHVSGTNYNMCFVQCRSCGGVVGVIPQRTVLLTEEIAKKVGARI